MERNWHNPAKQMPKNTKGRCKLCHKEFNNLDEHYKAKHKNEKIPR